jgi:hypothetical protein
VFQTEFLSRIQNLRKMILEHGEKIPHHLLFSPAKPAVVKSI